MYYGKYIKPNFYNVKYLVSTMHFYTIIWGFHLFAVVSQLKYMKRVDGNSGDSSTGTQGTCSCSVYMLYMHRNCF